MSRLLKFDADSADSSWAELTGSPEMTTAVRMCMDRLRGHGILLEEFTGRAEDVAIDLLTTEGVICNLADKLLSEQITDDLRDLASHPLFDSNNRWKMPNGTYVDLQPYPILREYARQIERLRQACLEAIESE